MIAALAVAAFVVSVFALGLAILTSLRLNDQYKQSDRAIRLENALKSALESEMALIDKIASLQNELEQLRKVGHL